MRGKERGKFWILMTFHMLWGLILWISISKYGLGVSTDAVHIFFGAFNLEAGNALRSYDGHFLAAWPPLYPILLAAIRRGTGLEMLQAALVLQVLTYVGMSISLSIISLRVFPDRFGLALATSVLAQIGPAMVVGFGMAGSDFVHLGLVVTAIALLGSYLESGSRQTYVWLGVTGILAALERYIGAAVIVTAVILILLHGRGTRRQRAIHSLIIGSTVIPTAVWLAVASRESSLRGPLTFAENFSWFVGSVVEWFAGAQAQGIGTAATTAFWLAYLALIALALWLFERRRARGEATRTASSGQATHGAFLLPLLLYALVYTAMLFGSAAFAYFNKLGGRFLLPLYVPFMLAVVLAVDEFLRAAAEARTKILRVAAAAVCYATLAGTAAALLRTTYPMMIASQAGGVAGGDNAYNNAAWHENAVLNHWKAHRPTGDFSLYSNEPDGVAFHTWQRVQYAPRSKSGPYASEAIPLARYESGLFAEGHAVYLFWLEDTTHEYTYSPEDLEEIALVEPLFTDESGGLYRLLPRSGG